MSIRRLLGLAMRAESRGYSILTRSEIEARIASRELVLEPLLQQVQPCSVDVRLDNCFGTFTTTGEAALDPGSGSRAIRFEEVPFFGQPFFLQPGTFILAQTLEFVALPNCIAATLDGRSSLGRRGLVVHATAGWIDPGWRGHVTLELANLGVMPLALYPGMRVGRLVFQHTRETGSYEGQFKNQLRIREPSLDDDCRRIAAYAAMTRTQRLQETTSS